WLGYVLDSRAGALGSLALRSVRLSAGVEEISSRWTTPSEQYEAYDDIAGAYTTIETQFLADFSIMAMRIALDAELALGARLALRVGPSISIPLSAESEQRESILSPSGAVFADRTQERLIAEGTGMIDDAG